MSIYQNNLVDLLKSLAAECEKHAYGPNHDAFSNFSGVFYSLAIELESHSYPASKNDRLNDAAKKVQDAIPQTMASDGPETIACLNSLMHFIRALIDEGQ